MKKLYLMCVPIPLLACLVCVPVLAQGTITSPKEQFGFNIGDDYQLANYTQLVEYWRKLTLQSDRIRLEEVGRTAEGRTMVMAVVTSRENHTQLARYKEIAGRLALAEGVSETEARKLALEGRAVVWIDGGLHATEVLGAQQLIETVYQMVSQNDPETLRVLRDVILLVACSNPDGMDLVSNWYMRTPQPEKRSMSNVPRLYQKYIGHDNNRDFYMSTQPETEAINRVFYHEWFPQIVYNHHQTGPAGTVLFAPPFRDPFNYHFDPLVPMGIDLVAAAIHNRFVAEGKPGATMRSGAGYSTWFNGGLRTTVYFHNMIGLLTEAVGNPTPVEIPFVPQNQLPRGDLPLPVAPQKWHFRQSVDYSLTANRAVLDVASKYREELLLNIYRMGLNSIDRGSRDNWTVVPHMISAIQEKIAADQNGSPGAEAAEERRQAGPASAAAPLKYYEMLRDPKARDPRGYILASDQPDFLTATKFVNALIKTGITIHRATAAFSVQGKNYPAGSFVVKTAQAFRPHILDMFEPQDHPDDLLYPGGPPRPTYDSAGWTLAYQMGMQFDRILEGFDGPFEEINGYASAPAGRVAGMPGAGFMLSRRLNDSYRAVNRLLASGGEVYWLMSPWDSDGRSFPAGTLFLPDGKGAFGQVRQLAEATGLDFTAVARRPAVDARKLRRVRIGLWDKFGGSISSGWTRWVLEQFEFPLDVVYAQTLDAGNLAAKYDVLIFPSGAIPRASRRGAAGSQEREAPPGQPQEPIDPATIPEEYRGWLGDITVEKTIPQLRQFADDGGTLIAVGSSTSLAYHLGLPVADALLERRPDGTERRIERNRLYVPGSLLQARVDNSNPVAHGMGDLADVYFDNSPVFRFLPEAGLGGIRPVAWFSGKRLLRSGWAIGEEYLDQGIVVVDAPVGKGRVYLFGPEITFRGQPHGTFKFLFNAILYGKSAPVRL